MATTTARKAKAGGCRRNFAGRQGRGRWLAGHDGRIHLGTGPRRAAQRRGPGRGSGDDRRLAHRRDEPGRAARRERVGPLLAIGLGDENGC